MFREIESKALNGLLMLAVLIAAALGSIASLILAGTAAAPGAVVASLLGLTISAIGLAGLFVNNPGDARVLTLFGTYNGTVKRAGFWWANPFMTKQKISLRVRNFETQKLKVNDAHSNPIEIAAVVVWKVVETAEALFEVDDYIKYVNVQSESALRALASSYPYDAHETGQEALSTHTNEVSVSPPEIAQAMLQRQQASAIIAARRKIVEGAVGMVENALELLSAKGIVTLDEERKAAMVSNLLVVLCSERSTQPIVNAGSIYQ